MMVTTTFNYVHGRYGKLGLTSSLTFTKDRLRWMAFTQEEVERIIKSPLGKPYGVTKLGRFVKAWLVESPKNVIP